MAVSTGETNFFQALNDGLYVYVQCPNGADSFTCCIALCYTCRPIISLKRCLTYVYLGVGFHGLLCDLLRRCVAGELGADETAAFFTDLTSHLVRRGHIFQIKQFNMPFFSEFF